MRLLSILCTFLLLVPTAKPEGAADIVAEMAKIIDSSSKALVDTKFLSLTSTMGQLARLMGPSGMVLSMALSFLLEAEQGPSAEMLAIQELHETTNQILTEVKTIREEFPAVVWNELYLADLNDKQALLETINKEATYYMGNPTATQLAQLRTACGEFQATKMLEEIKANFDTDDELQKFYIAMEYDYQAVDSSMSYLEGLIVTAGIQRTTCLMVDETVMGQSEEYVTEVVGNQATYWEQEVDEISAALGPVRQTKLIEFIEADKAYEATVDQFMADNSVLSQLYYPDFAEQLVAKLYAKFSFNDEVKFTVVTYNKDSGKSSEQDGWNFGTTGYHGTYDQGSLRLEQYGKTVVVFWTHCTQGSTFSFGVRHDNWDHLNQHLVECFPATYSHMYYWLKYDYAIAYNNEEYISVNKPLIERGYWLTEWWASNPSWHTSSGRTFLHVSLRDCAQFYQIGFTGSECYSDDVESVQQPSPWG